MPKRFGPARHLFSASLLIESVHRIGAEGCINVAAEPRCLRSEGKLGAPAPSGGDRMAQWL